MSTIKSVVLVGNTVTFIQAMLPEYTDALIEGTSIKSMSLNVKQKIKTAALTCGTVELSESEARWLASQLPELVSDTIPAPVTPVEMLAAEVGEVMDTWVAQLGLEESEVVELRALPSILTSKDMSVVGEKLMTGDIVGLRQHVTEVIGLDVALYDKLFNKAMPYLLMVKTNVQEIQVQLNSMFKNLMADALREALATPIQESVN